MIRRTLSEMSRKELLDIAKAECQQMVRAEAGAAGGTVLACVDDVWVHVPSPPGKCVCVTCGAIHPWRGTNKLDTGHAVSGRRQSIVFDLRHMAPQCVYCNRYRGGQQVKFLEWVRRVHGQEAIDEIERAAATESVTWQKDELLSKIREYRERTRAAAKRIFED